jgi:hypothetical protein
VFNVVWDCTFSPSYLHISFIYLVIVICNFTSVFALLERNWFTHSAWVDLSVNPVPPASSLLYRSGVSRLYYKYFSVNYFNCPCLNYLIKESASRFREILPDFVTKLVIKPFHGLCMCYVCLSFAIICSHLRLGLSFREVCQSKCYACMLCSFRLSSIALISLRVFGGYLQGTELSLRNSYLSSCSKSTLP